MPKSDAQNDESNDRIQKLFLAALELPPEQRDQWLMEQCGNDKQLLADVRSLLKHDRTTECRTGNRLAGQSTQLPGALDDSIVESGESDKTLIDSDQFFTKLSEVGVLSKTEFDALRRSVESGDSMANPRQLASRLVSEGILTDYQASALLTGQPDLLVDKYLILDLIESGGMGMVFKAIHRPMKRLVAIKMISPQLLSSPEQVKRFQREVRVAATLEHSNIVRAYDADQARGTHFLVMEYVRGQNLANMVRQKGPMSVAMSVDCILQSAKGLRYAHKNGIIHRDIKPGNLMRTEEGIIKVLDLGLANVDESFRLAQQSSVLANDDDDRQLLSVTDLTSAGAMLGTVSFMAPEQSLDAKKADVRSDIYSLGCTFYFLLVGEPPYRGETVFQVFLQHRDADVPTVRKTRPDVPQCVDVVCQKMLAKNPAERYQSMGELITAIENCNIAAPEITSNRNKEKTSKTRMIETVPSDETIAFHSPTQRNVRLRWAAITTVALLFIAATGYLIWKMSPLDTDQTAGKASVTDRAQLGSGDSGQSDPSPGDIDSLSGADLLATGEWEWRIEGKMGDPINNGYYVNSADLSQDRLTIVFASVRRGGHGNVDLWVATRISLENDWMAPVNLGGKVNSPHREYQPSISADGKLLTFTRDDLTSDKPPKLTSRRTYFSTRESVDSGWSDARLFVTSNENPEFVDLTSDSKTYVASRSDDLFIAKRASANVPWGEEFSVGSRGNMMEFVGGCTLSNDGKMIIFSHGMNHSMSLWSMLRVDDESPWEEPMQLTSLTSGTQENAPKLSSNGKSLLIASFRDGQNQIYSAKLVRKPLVPPIQTQPSEK